MTPKQAERIIETFDNASRNGLEWAHDVFLHRGTAKYERCLAELNEAFKVKEIDKTIQQLPGEAVTRTSRRMPKRMKT
ncbi:MAG TPA: hypothetical protein VLH08_18800 [Acidobacteriota bacterium]|nr:hypothetical protein [Acidobacteriota bacterium]